MSDAPKCPNCGNTMSKKHFYKDSQGGYTDTKPDDNAKPEPGYSRWYCPGCGEPGGTTDGS